MHPFLPLWLLDFVSFLILELLMEGKDKKKSEEWRQVAGQLRKKWAGKGERMGVTGNWQVEE